MPDVRSQPATVGTSPVSTEGPGSATAHPRFRGDVEGLRAIAVGLVLLYHAGLPWVSGGFVGVDVFFVISGFLITGQLLKEVDRTGHVSLTRFYARRAKRLLPATAVVLVATVVMVLVWVPRIRWEDVGTDIVAAALYVVNWRFAEQSVDYLAEDVAPSPVLHFWSLAVEEQYYLVWPLLILLVTLWARRVGHHGRPRLHHLWLGLAVVAVPSFLWSVWYSGRSASAFFITTTRMWELAVGAGVAIGVGLWGRVPRRAALALGWGGLAAIGAAGLLYTEELTWPGYAAALPVLGTAAVIAAGAAAGPRGPVAVLGTAPFRWVGALSYSIYLWHWPLLVVATAALGELSLGLGLLIAALSVIPAWLAYTLVESPLRYSRTVSSSPRLALSLGANFTLVGVVAGLVLLLAVPSAGTAPAGAAVGARALTEAQPSTRATESADPTPRATASPDDPAIATRSPAAAAPVAGAPVDTAESITPDPLSAPEDLPDVYERGCQADVEQTEPITCSYGPAGADTTVAVVGDSKIAQWMTAIAALAEERDWRVTTYTKSACSFTDAAIANDRGPYEECAEFNDNVMDRLRADPPDVVLTSQGRREALDADGRESRQLMVDGLRSRWADVAELGSRVVVLGDTPQPGFIVYECVAENRNRLTKCTYERERGVAASALRVQAEAVEGSEAAFVDMTGQICPTPRCAPVIGNVLVYRQGSHLTATYVTSMTQALGAALAKAEPRLAPA